MDAEWGGVGGDCSANQFQYIYLGCLKIYIVGLLMALKVGFLGYPVLFCFKFNLKFLKHYFFFFFFLLQNVLIE